MSQRRLFYGWAILATSASIIGVTREYFGERIMGSAYGAVFLVSTTGMCLGSFAEGAIDDRLGSSVWLYLGSGGFGLAAILLALHPPSPAPVAQPVTPASVNGLRRSSAVCR